jgi:hypothetical protein
VHAGQFEKLFAIAVSFVKLKNLTRFKKLAKLEKLTKPESLAGFEKPTKPEKLKSYPLLNPFHSPELKGLSPQSKKRKQWILLPLLRNFLTN